MKLSKRPTQVDSILSQANNAEGFDSLHSYQEPDTDPEEVINDLAQLSAFICGTPMSVVSLTDGERQWFKAIGSLDAKQLPREHAFCQHAMLSSDVYEIPDTAADLRYAQNALVTGQPGIRFYVGAPLFTPEGQTLGILCALDTVPRHLNNEQYEALRALARQAMAHLELRRTCAQLDNERHRLNGMLRMANSTKDSLPTATRNEIFVKQDQRLVRIATADLQYVEALGDYVNLYTTRERITVYGTMKDLEAKLPSHDFARVHRKYIVRLDRIVAIETDAALLHNMRDSQLARTPVRVPIGSSYKAGLLGRLILV